MPTIIFGGYFEQNLIFKFTFEYVDVKIKFKMIRDYRLKNTKLKIQN